MCESFRPAWTRRFHQETVRHPLDLRITPVGNDCYRVEMIGGGFMAQGEVNLLERLVEKKHFVGDKLREIMAGLPLAEEKRELAEAWIEVFETASQPGEELVWQFEPVSDLVMAAGD